MVKKILQLEGLVFFLAALVMYSQLHGSWLFFALLLFTPDISMIGYLKDKKLGATLYNLMHNYVLPLIIIGMGEVFIKNTVTQLGIILLAHVGLDRFLGYGLKYSSAFKDTHLQKL